MRALREHPILSFSKHYENVTWEYSLKILKHLKKKKTKTFQKKKKSFLNYHFENIINKDHITLTINVSEGSLLITVLLQSSDITISQSAIISHI